MNSCRGCEDDDECTSRVCDAGVCVAESAVLYAAPNGLDSSGDCSLGAPCSLSRTLMLALGAAVPPIVRLLPGVYPSGISISTRTSATFRIVASGAALGAPGALQVLDGADVSIKGVTATGSGTETVRCTSSTSSSKLVIRNAVIEAVGSAHAVSLSRCEVRLEAT